MKLASPKNAIGGGAGQDAAHRLTAAFERNAHEVGPVLAIEAVEEQSERNRRCDVGQGTGFGFGKGRKLRETVHAERSADDQRLRVEEEVGDRRKSFARIVGQFLEQELVVDKGLAGQDADRIAIRFGVRASPACDNIGATGTRIDDQRLAEAAMQFFAERAGKHIGSAAGADIDDRADGARRIVVRHHGTQTRGRGERDAEHRAARN